jgi:hypothetical protein
MAVFLLSDVSSIKETFAIMEDRNATLGILNSWYDTNRNQMGIRAYYMEMWREFSVRSVVRNFQETIQ